MNKKSIVHLLATEDALPSPPPQSITIHLANIPLLNGIDANVLRQIGGILQYRRVEKGNFVLHKGDSGDHFLFLLAGRLRVVDITEDGRELGLSILSSGDYFGELSIIDNQPRSASVIAMENSLIALMPAVHAARLIYSHPLVAERIMKNLAQKIRAAANHRAILGLPNAHQRVFALLAQFSEMAENRANIINNMPTQQDIAIMANTRRETVSRAITLLIQNGIVEKDSRRLIIKDPQRLKMLASEHGNTPQ